MDALRYIWWVVVALGAPFGLVVAWWEVATMIEEAPHLLLPMAALAVLAGVGVRALVRALRPKLLGGRRSWWR